MDKPVIVLGAGGHAKVVLDILISQSAKIIGIVDSDFNKIGTKILGISVIGDDSIVEQYPTQSIYLVNGLGSIGSTKAREALFIKFKKCGYDFATIIHKSAVIASDVELKEGTQVFAGAVIQTGTIIGHNSIINTKTSIDHDCHIEPHVHISPGVTICGNVIIGERTHIGAGTTIIQGIKIGTNAIIGAGSVVLRDQAENTMAFGVPAKEVIT